MWNLRPDERLRHWRQFRNDIGALDIENALKETLNLWSFAPYVTHYLHPDDAKEWPDPWTLVHENYYCDLAKCLGMLYTLCLSSHYGAGIEHLEIRIYRNGTDIYNTLWVNGGKYILNLEFNTIVNKSSINNDYRLQHQIPVNDLALDLQ